MSNSFGRRVLLAVNSSVVLFLLQKITKDYIASATCEHENTLNCSYNSQHPTTRHADICSSIYYYVMMDSLRTFQSKAVYMHNNSFGRCAVGNKRQMASTLLNFLIFFSCDCRKEKKAAIKSTFSMAAK